MVRPRRKDPKKTGKISGKKPAGTGSKKPFNAKTQAMERLHKKVEEHAGEEMRSLKFSQTIDYTKRWSSLLLYLAKRLREKGENPNRLLELSTGVSQLCEENLLEYLKDSEVQKILLERKVLVPRKNPGQYSEVELEKFLRTTFGVKMINYFVKKYLKEADALIHDELIKEEMGETELKTVNFVDNLIFTPPFFDTVFPTGNVSKRKAVERAMQFAREENSLRKYADDFYRETQKQKKLDRGKQSRFGSRKKSSERKWVKPVAIAMVPIIIGGIGLLLHFGKGKSPKKKQNIFQQDISKNKVKTKQKQVSRRSQISEGVSSNIEILRTKGLLNPIGATAFFEIMSHAPQTKRVIGVELGREISEPIRQMRLFKGRRGMPRYAGNAGSMSFMLSDGFSSQIALGKLRKDLLSGRKKAVDLEKDIDDFFSDPVQLFSPGRGQKNRSQEGLAIYEALHKSGGRSFKVAITREIIKSVRNMDLRGIADRNFIRAHAKFLECFDANGNLLVDYKQVTDIIRSVGRIDSGMADGIVRIAHSSGMLLEDRFPGKTAQYNEEQNAENLSPIVRLYPNLKSRVDAGVKKAATNAAVQDHNIKSKVFGIIMRPFERHRISAKSEAQGR